MGFYIIAPAKSHRGILLQRYHCHASAFTPQLTRYKSAAGFFHLRFRQHEDRQQHLSADHGAAVPGNSRLHCLLQTDRIDRKSGFSADSAAFSGGIDQSPQYCRSESWLQTVNIWIVSLYPVFYVCREKLNAILPFTESELEFLTAVNKRGKIKSELLSDSQAWCELVSKHPMLQWKVFNVRKHYGL